MEELSKKEVILMAKMLANGVIDKVPTKILNSTIENISLFLETFQEKYDGMELSKTCMAGLIYLNKLSKE